MAQPSKKIPSSGTAISYAQEIQSLEEKIKKDMSDWIDDPVYTHIINTCEGIIGRLEVLPPDPHKPDIDPIIEQLKHLDDILKTNLDGEKPFVEYTQHLPRFAEAVRMLVRE